MKCSKWKTCPSYHEDDDSECNHCDEREEALICPNCGASDWEFARMQGPCEVIKCKKCGHEDCPEAM